MPDTAAVSLLHTAPYTPLLSTRSVPSSSFSVMCVYSEDPPNPITEEQTHGSIYSPAPSDHQPRSLCDGYDDGRFLKHMNRYCIVGAHSHAPTLMYFVLLIFSVLCWNFF